MLEDVILSPSTLLEDGSKDGEPVEPFIEGLRSLCSVSLGFIRGGKNVLQSISS